MGLLEVRGKARYVAIVDPDGENRAGDVLTHASQLVNGTLSLEPGDTVAAIPAERSSTPITCTSTTQRASRARVGRSSRHRLRALGMQRGCGACSRTARTPSSVRRPRAGFYVPINYRLSAPEIAVHPPGCRREGVHQPRALRAVVAAAADEAGIPRGASRTGDSGFVVRRRGRPATDHPARRPLARGVRRCTTRRAPPASRRA